eukprot:jgi/Tetstr1/434376/TSEL_023477.t1
MEDAGKTNPLWQVGLAKFGWIMALVLAFRCLQPLLNSRVRACEAQHVAAVAAAPDSFDSSFDEAADRRSHTYPLALMKALQMTSRTLVPIIIGLVAFEMLSDFIEDIMFVSHSENICLQVLKPIGDFLQSTARTLDKMTHVLVIAFIGNFLINLKDQLVEQFLKVQVNGGQYAKRGVFQTVVGLSAYLNYIVYAIGGAAAAAALGVDISPLLAVGGVSGLAIGLGAKELAAAILGCIQLLTSNQFQPGDVVEMKKDQHNILKGTVVSISPLRTKFVSLSDNRVPWTIPNQDLSKMMISNRSRLHMSRANIRQLDNLREMRKIQFVMSFEFQQEKDAVVAEVPSIMELVKKTVDAHPETSEQTTASWVKFSGKTATLEVVAFLDVLPSRYDAVKAEVIVEVDPGKSTLCRELEAAAARESPKLRVVRLSFDEVEDELAAKEARESARGAEYEFDSERWREARAVAFQRLKAVLAEAMGGSASRTPSTLVLVDDNLHYRSMRYQCFQVARDAGAAYLAVYLDCDVELAMERNAQRAGCAQTLLAQWGSAPEKLMSEAERRALQEAGRAGNASSQAHAVDLRCRRVIGEVLRGLSSNGTTSGQPSKGSIAAALNASRRALLEACKAAASRGSTGERADGQELGAVEQLEAEFQHLCDSFLIRSMSAADATAAPTSAP